MMDCLIIHPGAQHGIYGQLGDTLTALEPPTWCRMIAGYLLNRDHDVSILDTEVMRLSPAQVAEIVIDRKPRLVAIVVAGHQPSASTQQMTGAGAIALAIKQASPHQLIIMIGNHPSALSERTLREEAVDYVADGEGPVTIDSLLHTMDGPINATYLSYVPGLVWRDGSVIRRNPIAPLIENLDEDLHGRAWGLLPMNQYRAHNWQMFGRDPATRSPYASLYTSLGCPYKCSFCMINAAFHSNRYRTFSPEEVVDQIQLLRQLYGVTTLKFADEMFVLNPNHYTAICNEILGRGLNAQDDLSIWAYARVDTVKPEHLKLLRSAGFRWLALGIESGSAEVRDGADKRLRRDDIVDVVRTIQNHDINVIGNFMFGLRDDTAMTMQQTLDLALICQPDFANFYSTMAYPGSRLYEEAIQNSWPLPSTWRGYSQHNDDCHPLANDNLAASDILRFRDEAFQVFYKDHAYRWHVNAKFGPSALADVDQMLSYRLPRKLLGGAAV